MTQNLVETRTYRYEDESTGKQKTMKVNYRINLRAGRVTHVFNEFNNSVNTNSEVFEYFSSKFNS
jgi:hypothetical protein